MNAPLPQKVIHADQQRNELSERLTREVQGEILFGRGDRGRYATDASIYQADPIGVLVPKTFDDVRIAASICAELRAPFVARGGGTSQCGQTVGPALILDNSKYLNRVLSFDHEGMTVTVEPGIVLDHLNAWLKPHGVWFPVDVSTSAQCTLGGMAGNNSCGSRSIQYGNMVHNVLSIDALLADGTEGQFGPLAAMPTDSGRIASIVRRLQEIAVREHDEIARTVPKVLRRVGGYNLDIFNPQSERPYTADNSPNLAHLLVGSEGTLALTRQITLQLAPLPVHKTLGVVNFPTFYQAMDMAQHIVKLGPVAVELVDRTMIDLARNNPAFGPTIERALLGEPQAILLVEFAGIEQDEQVARLRQLVELMGDLGLPNSVVEMPEAAAQQALWSVRKAGLNIMMSMRGDGKPVSFIEDCAVPLEHLAEYTSRLTEVFHKHGTSGTWYAHASVGTLHVRPILDMRTDGAGKMRAIAEEASAIVREYKGAFSGEHGDGLARSEWVSWQFGPRMTQAFEEIKDLFDPQGLMNPGKIVRSPKFDDVSLFRFNPTYQVLPLAAALDWSSWNVTGNAAAQTTSAPGTGGDPSHGFAKAIEMCNNNGHCRKFDAGTMCPSYRVTHDERHLTRGRANTLRLALSGQMGPDAFTSEEVRQTLDLCVSCKGCKRECPTGVDMAKMKIEFLYQWQKQHGLRLKDKLIATMPRWAPWAARLPWLFNLRDTVPGAAWLSERLLGLSARRSLPRWRRDTFLATAHSDHNDDADVVLFADTFNNYLESENARAALSVLQAAGYKVHIARAHPKDSEKDRPLCCGRTYLSAGLVDEAKAEARRVVQALSPFIARGIPVVGLEPSCLLSLRDEFLVMGMGEDASKLARLSFLFEEFLAREHTAGTLHLALKPLPEKKALLHGHCHQKAFDAVKPVLTVLAMIPELDVNLIESSCCGMAGSFGYEATHYDVSMQMAELSLLPAVRKADADTLLVADGTSCRHQIADGSGRKAEHVACVLARALA
ncbi:FAD-binding and (Fe-S)-binding domain-containing protein [Pusillimonas sp. ANT_WB101]|uniref:FAD-binding and (Fe-S)-binding domain-containing protein n=1 Tax=Pusillimonas sp. ANT_WB101 TaxID=2597356 RepID=UPI0011EFE1E8|nr:FAD-binding and (Fe-S)-binding domain-containing protein [Pusillimonas sp. ANT_WB101]KAA0892636.1 FAD-binding protein [Pusillimonas sp. ANT_WB101]